VDVEGAHALLSSLQGEDSDDADVACLGQITALLAGKHPPFTSYTTTITTTTTTTTDSSSLLMSLIPLSCAILIIFRGSLLDSFLTLYTTDSLSLCISHFLTHQGSATPLPVPSRTWAVMLCARDFRLNWGALWAYGRTLSTRAASTYRELEERKAETGKRKEKAWHCKKRTPSHVSQGPCT
jgi:hypothetical protein